MPATSKWRDATPKTSAWDVLADRWLGSDEGEAVGSRDFASTLRYGGEAFPVSRNLYVVDDVSHGFSQGDVIRINSSGALVEALATTQANVVDIVGVVAASLTTDIYLLLTFGRYDGFTSLSAGTIYYLQDGGGLGSSAGTISVPIVKALSTTEVYFLQNRAVGLELGDLTDVDFETAAAASGDIVQFDGTDWVPVSRGELLRPTISAAKTTDYELVAADEQNVIKASGASAAVEITLPDGLDEGWTCTIICTSNATGAVTIAPDSGTLTTIGSLDEIIALGAVVVMSQGSDNWRAWGDLE